MPGTYISPAETEFYYLQSRYYNPEVGRFINADAENVVNLSAGQEYKNLYAYCDNNPIVRIDVGGTAWQIIAIKFGCHFVFNMTMSLITNLANGELPSAIEVTSIFVNSAVDAITDKGLFIKACFTAATTIVESLDDGDSGGTALKKATMSTVRDVAFTYDFIKDLLKIDFSPNGKVIADMLLPLSEDYLLFGSLERFNDSNSLTPTQKLANYLEKWI